MVWYLLAYVAGFATVPIIYIAWIFVLEIKDAWNAPDEQLRPWARWVRAYLWRPFLHMLDSVDWALGRPMYRALMAYARKKGAVVVTPRDKVKP